jgi:hypothetical protein
LSHSTSPSSSGFGDRVSLFAQACLEHDPPIFCFPFVARLTGVHYPHTQLFSLEMDLRNFLSGLA